MTDFLDRLYSSVIDKNNIFSKLRFYSMIRFLIRLISNILLPIYFFLTQRNKKYKLSFSSKSESLIIVSLTTFPARIDRIWLVIETLLRQTQKPDKIILWLSTDQFNNIQILPNSLLKLQTRGLEIRFCEENLRSHKKYFYALKEFPDEIIITVDDDVFYQTQLVENLVKLHQKFSNCVCCNHCSEIEVADRKIQPYITWKNYNNAEYPNYKIFPIGIGGVLYPPNVLDYNVFDSEAFIENCFMADDIWLNAMTKLKGNMAVKSNYNSNYLPIMNCFDKTLTSINVNEGMNDIQLSSIRYYCKKDLGRDPFEILETI